METKKKVITKQYVVELRRKVIVEAVNEEVAKIKGAKYFRGKFFTDDDVKINQELKSK